MDLMSGIHHLNHTQKIQREMCTSMDRAMDWWKDNGPSILKVTANKYDNLSKTWKDLFKRGGEEFNEFWSEKVGENIINRITSNNKMEQELYNMFKYPISKYLAFEYNSDKDYYYTNDGKTIQKLSGFADLFDDAGTYLGMDLDTQIINFKYNNKNYRLQFWKGTYGYGNAYGGEIGLYENTDGGSWYASVDGKEEIRTSQRIYDNKGNTLLENDVSSYTKEGKHFWNLAIRSDAGYDKNDLHQESILYIDDAEYREKLRKEISKNKFLTATEKDNKLIVVYK